ncbi:MAG: hypothetical protein JMN24_13155 [gamma proteobacterium endosymbiont of Lamellibrachia anaximandri]|nr:hypothetical protein [gamma proteobacterium endosymbiont of Lamellibrachia anaximandri]
MMNELFDQFDEFEDDLWGPIADDAMEPVADLSVGSAYQAPVEWNGIFTSPSEENNAYLPDVEPMDQTDLSSIQSLDSGELQPENMAESFFIEYPVFDPENADLEQIVGDPAQDMENWHMQSTQSSCALVSQEFILDKVLGRDVTEEELTSVATDAGWYTPGGGTPMNEMGRILEHFECQVDYDINCTMDDLSAKLEQGESILVALDSDEIWNTGADLDDILSEYFGMPGQDANHAVQVIGIDYSDQGSPKVILNDPGSPDGSGVMIPADKFMDAWEDSNHFMVSSGASQVSDQMIGNYYDRYGTWYYDDGTPERYNWDTGYY